VTEKDTIEKAEIIAVIQITGSVIIYFFTHDDYIRIHLLD